MKAIVMAGGFGNRLRPLTLACPKPMLPLTDKPVLAHILELLKYHRFSEVMIATHYLPEQIQDYFGDGRHIGMTLHYSVEESPLGTAGSVKNIQPYLDDEPFLVISGDIVTDINLSEVVQFHQENGALATLTLTNVADPTQYGVVITDHTGRIRQYLEKPCHHKAITNSVNTGIYVLEPKLLESMQPNSVYDFSFDIFPQMLKQKQPLFGYPAEGYWCDMGTIQNYQQCQDDVRCGKVKLARGAMRRERVVSEAADVVKTSQAGFVEPPYWALDPLRKQQPMVDTLPQRAPAVQGMQ